MSPAMVKKIEDENQSTDENGPSQYIKGVKLLHDAGIKNLPRKYILPLQERPNNNGTGASSLFINSAKAELIKLPIIDMEELRGPNRSNAIKSLSDACKSFGFFQVVNHGVSEKVIGKMMNVGRGFFELPYEVRSRYMSSDMRSPVRCGTSFNQNKDGVFCWRDFLKLLCDSSSPDVLAQWPDSPTDLRSRASAYSKESSYLFVKIMEAILESLGLNVDSDLKEFRNGSQLMVVNCYPPCPQPDLTLGMPPHSDYGFITLLLQDEVPGLQIQHQGKWVTVDPITNSFVVNIGDQLEIFSNGLYKSVLHRVLANPKRLRTSIASLHALAFDRIVRPCDALVQRQGKKLYKDTGFADFMEYTSTREPKGKNFLETRKLY